MDNRTDLIVRLWNESRRYFGACTMREPLLGPQDVDDLASDVMIAIIPRLDSLQDPDRYMRRVARNRVLRVLRQRRVAHSVEECLSMHGPCVLAVGVEEGDSLNDRSVLVLETARSVLMREDDTTREMVALRCDSPSKTFAEISHRTGVTSSALRMRMSRFTKRVRSSLPASVT